MRSNVDLQINMGSIVGNVIVRQQECDGFHLNYFDGKKNGEIDFAIQNGMGIDLVMALMCCLDSLM